MDIGGKAEANFHLIGNLGPLGTTVGGDEVLRGDVVLDGVVAGVAAAVVELFVYGDVACKSSQGISDCV